MLDLDMFWRIVKEIVSVGLLLVSGIFNILLYRQNRRFKKLECDKEIQSLRLKLEPLEEKLPRLDRFLKAKHATEGIAGSAESLLRRLKIKKAEREISEIKNQINYFEKVEKNHLLTFF